MAWVVKRAKLNFKKVFFWNTLMGNVCRSFSLASILAPAAGEAGGENSIRKVHLDFSNMEENGECRGGCRKKYMSTLEHGEWRDRKGCRIQKYIISWRMENEEEGAEKIQKYMSTLGHKRGRSMRMSRQTNYL